MPNLSIAAATGREQVRTRLIKLTGLKEDDPIVVGLLASLNSSRRKWVALAKLVRLEAGPAIRVLFAQGYRPASCVNYLGLVIEPFNQRLRIESAPPPALAGYKPSSVSVKVTDDPAVEPGLDLTATPGSGYLPPAMPANRRVWWEPDADGRRDCFRLYLSEPVSPEAWEEIAATLRQDARVARTYMEISKLSVIHVVGTVPKRRLMRAVRNLAVELLADHGYIFAGEATRDAKRAASDDPVTTAMELAAALVAAVAAQPLSQDITITTPDGVELRIIA